MRNIVIALFLLPLAINLPAQSLTVSFDQKDVQIFSGELLTNVVKIVNNEDQPQTIVLTYDFPFGWRKVGLAKQSYTINPHDSIFAPIRLIPASLMGGNNKYMINVNVLSPDDKFITGGTFWAFTKKQTSWSLTSIQGNKVYFRNGENTVNFQVNVLNTGAEAQPITMTLNNLSLFATVVDSLGANKTLKPIQLNLKNMQDTTLRFVYKYEAGERNLNRIDIENYRPNNNTEEKTFNLFVNTEEPNLGQEGAFNTSQRITFKKLSDRTKSNPNAFSHAPVIVDYNVSNLLDNISFSTLNIRGNAQVSPEAQIMYNMQASATSDRYNDVLKNTNYYFGYFHIKGSIQLGFVNGGFMGLQSFGKGVKGSYNIGRRTSFSAFYVTNSDRYGERYLISKGASAQFKYFKQNKVVVEYGESDNKATGVFTRALNTRTGINFLRTQTINLSFSNTWNTNAQNKNTTGRFYLVNYGGTFFKNKLAVNHGLGNSNADYSGSNLSRFFYNHRTRITLSEKWNMTVVNNYTKTSSLLYFNANYSAVNNQLSFTRSFRFQSVQLAAIYNIFEFTAATNVVKAFSVNHNTFKPKEYFRFSSTVEAGVSSPKTISGQTADYPYMLFNSILFYKTLSVNARYTMGSYGSTPVVNLNTGTGITQQLFSTAIQHQYVFPNTQFMLQTGFNYFYNNIFKQHTINLFPEIYYFTSTGWRFRAGLNYNMITGDALKNVYNNQLASEETPRVTSQGMFVSMGVRKEFSVPVPFKKQKFIESEFQVFYDVNGNGIKDKNERPVENVVIRVNEDEVITNAEGGATIVDAAAGIAKIGIMPLDEVEGWFPNIGDSIILSKSRIINIPFVKGVKIKGKVSIQRESIAADADEPFDLSRIKITASSGKSFSTLTGFDGSFEFYLPFGEYIVSFDESILGDKFRLARNNYSITVNKEADGLVISYHIIEKTRKINKKVFTQPNSTTPQNGK